MPGRHGGLTASARKFSPSYLVGRTGAGDGGWREAGSRIGLAFIRFSADEGATWRTEYSNFDRAAYEAEQKTKP